MGVVVLAVFAMATQTLAIGLACCVAADAVIPQTLGDPDPRNPIGARWVAAMAVLSLALWGAALSIAMGVL